MKTFELVEKLHELMRQTGKGGREIQIISDDGYVLDIVQAKFDPENEKFFLITEEAE